MKQENLFNLRWKFSTKALRKVENQEEFWVLFVLALNMLPVSPLAEDSGSRLQKLWVSEQNGLIGWRKGHLKQCVEAQSTDLYVR